MNLRHTSIVRLWYPQTNSSVSSFSGKRFKQSSFCSFVLIVVTLVFVLLITRLTGLVQFNVFQLLNELELFVKLKDGDSSTVSGFQENWKSVSVKVKNWLQSSKFIPDDQEFTPGMLCVRIRYICLIVFNGVVSLFKTKPKLYFIMWLTTFGLSLSSRLWVYEVFSDKINLKNDSVNYPEAFTSVSILMKHVFFFARWNLRIFPGTCHFSWKSVLSSSGEHVSSGMLSIILDIQWLE